MSENTLTILIAILGCSGLWSLIEMFVHRKHDKDDKNDIVIQKIDTLSADVKNVKDQLEAQSDDIKNVKRQLDIQSNEIQDVKYQLDSHIADEQMQAAITARARIVRVANEFRDGHAVDDEVLESVMDDITFYESYCEKHKEFKNNKTKLSIKLLNEEFNKIDTDEHRRSRDDEEVER